MKDVTVYLRINKVDDEQRMVWGYASTEEIDSEGERIAIDSIKACLPGYMKFGNIREMHQPSAVGKAKETDFDEKGLYLGAKIVDDVAWKKVKEGVYNGYSIGGRGTKEGDLVTLHDLVEISLVDRPANPSATFDVWKGGSDKMDPKEIQKMLDGAVGTIAETIKPITEKLGELEKEVQKLKGAGTPTKPKADPDDAKGESELVLKMQAQIDELQESLVKREKEDIETRKKLVLDAAASAGKFRVAERKQWEKDYDANPKMVERILKTMAAVVPIGERKGSGGSGDDKSADEQFNDLVEAEVQKVMANEKIDWATAYPKAVNSVTKRHPQLWETRSIESLQQSARAILPGFGAPGAPGE